MKKFVFTAVAACFLVTGSVLAQLQSPAEFLGYELGEKWTPHYKVMNYFRHVADESPMVSLTQYGTTNEGRELMYAVVTTEANHQNLDEIRTNNLKLADLEAGTPSPNQKAIVWLSYNVHGNETSSSEAALNTVYKLVTEHANWLENTVVVMDPMVNPDGRDRYVNWYRSVVGEKKNVHPETREHDEPWPGGRTNHYYFDLNRDWAWQTQVESQQRIRVYNEWMPHVHVDFHEQGYNSPYYFAPAAEPFHMAITDWQRQFQTMIGKNHTKYFDEENWLYFTREVFDLFYPSYGDTWPTFNGAIGMTYEQAGHSAAGRGVITAEGDTLTLLDRLTHHTVSGLSTVEITAQNSKRVIQEFSDYFTNTNRNGAGEYKTFVVKKSSNLDKVSRLLRYLVNQRIDFGVASRSSNANGYDYSTGETGRVSIEGGDYVISTYQPKGTLVRVLFEPKPELADSLTYDITAWEMHYAYGVDGYAIKGQLDTEPLSMSMEDELTPVIDKPYAYLAKWNSIEDLRYLARLLDEGVAVRYAEKAFTLNGKEYAPGTLIITRNGNEKLGDKFDEIVKDEANLLNRIVTPVTTGFVDSGKDFGSSSVRYIEKPKVALLSGEGTNSNMVGHIWNYFDQQINYPVNLINADDVGSVNWDDYHVLILPDTYGSAIGSGELDAIKEWVSSGGTLIAVGSANNDLAGKDGFSLKRKERDNEESEDPEDKLQKYGEASRERAQYFNPGSIFQISMDTSHPLAFGYDEDYMSLKLGSSAFDYLANGWNVGAAKPGAHRSGFVGNKAKESLEHTLAFGVQDMGAGHVVYMIDNPLFRGFWHNGKLLFGNAVFFVGN
ncbi:MAG: zinc carboxypeptidase [Gracilimonas sp.]|uniref:M14 family metallopeptidase n=1 Tax=Gracilimonas sp. TaxID=1974203 RepID=UPI001AFD30DB|nr:M14 family metallopeptidase [Gracilimonas sp.]MBO6585124.1 zinc carboxypeptidase [Gracilimonas sp.]MBO6615604.1 zinc carboxypeptidase [Gracilimonas sp.]